VILSPWQKMTKRFFSKRVKKAPRPAEERLAPRAEPAGSPEVIGLKAANFDLLQDLATMKDEKEKLEVRFNEMAADLQAKDELLKSYENSIAAKEEASIDFMEQFVGMLGTFKKKRGRKAWKASRSAQSATATAQ
jgi:hypothetical protein